MSGLIANYLLSGSGTPSAAPDLFSEWGFYQDSTTGIVYRWSPVALTWSPLGVSSGGYALRAEMWQDEALWTVGTPTVQYSTGPTYFTYTDSSGANGDTFTNSFWMAAGTYTLTALGVTANSRGKLDWYIDNVLQGAGGQDWYSSSTVWDVFKTLSVTVATDGYHALKGVVNGKNGSSSNYYISLTKYWLTPSAD